MSLRSMSLRRAAPWIASLAAHALLVLLVPLGADLRGMRSPVAERHVVLEFDAVERPPAAPPASSPPAPAIGRTGLPLPTSLPMPSAPLLDPVTEELRAASVRVATVPGGVPSPREILDALPPVVIAASDVARADAAAESTMRVEWSGKPRSPIREGKLRFPSILSETGLMAEVVARITVSPLGAVIDVEITRSSGYTEIDAAVERALRQNLYPRIDGKQNETGTVYYRFPLEKRD
jgi:TonB family protein